MNITNYDSDELEKLISPITLNNRNLLWLGYWIIDSSGNTDNEDISTPSFSEQITRILYYVKNHPHLLANAKLKLTNSILHEKCFSWMKEGERLEKWLTYKCSEKLLPLIGNHPVPGIDLIIMKFDLWDETTLTKELYLRELQSKWKDHKSNDKTYKWFDCQEKVNLADEWLDRNKPVSYPYRNPKPKIHDKENLISYFEDTYIDITEIKYLITQIKKRWSQNNYRNSNQEKTQKNLLLSKNSTKALGEMSKSYGISQSKVIDILIEMEQKNQLYLPEKT